MRNLGILPGSDVKRHAATPRLPLTPLSGASVTTDKRLEAPSRRLEPAVSVRCQGNPGHQLPVPEKGIRHAAERRSRSPTADKTASCSDRDGDWGVWRVVRVCVSCLCVGVWVCRTAAGWWPGGGHRPKKACVLAAGCWLAAVLMAGSPMGWQFACQNTHITRYTNGPVAFHHPELLISRAGWSKVPWCLFGGSIGTPLPPPPPSPSPCPVSRGRRVGMLSWTAASSRRPPVRARWTRAGDPVVDVMSGNLKRGLAQDLLV